MVAAAAIIVLRMLVSLLAPEIRAQRWRDQGLRCRGRPRRRTGGAAYCVVLSIAPADFGFFAIRDRTASR
jgi:hypothetical protein